VILIHSDPTHSDFNLFLLRVNLPLHSNSVLREHILQDLCYS